jgi:hypothetical protein
MTSGECFKNKNLYIRYIRKACYVNPSWACSLFRNNKQHVVFGQKRKCQRVEESGLWRIQRERWIEVKYLPNGTNAVQDYIYWIISTENDHRHHHKFIKYEKQSRKEGKNMFGLLIRQNICKFSASNR